MDILTFLTFYLNHLSSLQGYFLKFSMPTGFPTDQGKQEHFEKIFSQGNQEKHGVFRQNQGKKFQIRGILQQ